jgi:hypothetical protein
MTRLIALVTLAAAILFLPAARAQDFSYRDGTLVFDKKGFKTEFDKMQRDLGAGKQARRSKNYCISCYDGKKFNCRAAVGGKIGQGLCLLGGAASCNPPGTNGVTKGTCTSGGTGQTRT